MLNNNKYSRHNIIYVSYGYWEWGFKWGFDHFLFLAP